VDWPPCSPHRYSPRYAVRLRDARMTESPAISSSFKRSLLYRAAAQFNAGPAIAPNLERTKVIAGAELFNQQTQSATALLTSGRMTPSLIKRVIARVAHCCPQRW